MLKSLVILLRPQQWLKNLFVLAPAFFAGSFLVADVLRDSLLTFIIFSAAASTVYIFNDWIDRQADSKHPEKKTRPAKCLGVSGKYRLTPLRKDREVNLFYTKPINRELKLLK